MAFVDFSLSGKGMANIPPFELSGPFTFLVGGVRYPSLTLTADFLSPAIARLRSTDPSLTEFRLETRDDARRFPSFLSLATGGSIRIDRSNFDFFLLLAEELGNFELVDSICAAFESEFSLSRILRELSSGEILSERLLSLAASQAFRDGAPSEVIPGFVLFQILQNSALQLLTEDSLFQYIFSRISVDSDYLSLFRFVRFDFLSPSCIAQFVSLNSALFDTGIWSALSCRLILPSSLPRPPRLSGLGVPEDEVVELQFALSEKDPMNGIVSYLTRKHGSGLSERGIVSITAKSVASDKPLFATKNLAVFNAATYFFSKDEPNQWVRWTFHNMRLRPTHYAIQSCGTYGHLKNWVLECSMDSLNWKEIDRRSDNGDVQRGNDRLLVRTFQVAKSIECRYIRLTQTGKNNSGNNHLVFAAMEFFGTLIE
jgi:hypothetical protein